jgi:hypothetical protein
MAKIAILRQDPAVDSAMFPVVATKAARAGPVPEIAGIGVPADLEGRVDVGSVRFPVKRGSRGQ